ncbi:proline--tRNA ligase [Candidatus Woesearchaeota archaeon]|nr:proline--tRNA ligase [Candidatus Woesearchaeota archaeon]
MAKEENKGVTVKKSEDMPEWYSQVCLKAELADYSPVKGTMVIRPYGYAIWQKIMDHFNKVMESKGVKNAYFPLFIPESFFKKEAEHAKGFAPEVAWVDAKSEEGEKYALRPTSETIMYYSYAKWIRSWRDLPLRINQWCNIVRWEVSDCKLFIRSREFLWQEGHCVYASEGECDNETLMFLGEYKKLCQDLLAIPVLMGKKTDKEKFAGAKYTTTIESFMPDGKALQMGTSHNLGQGFAKVFGISYLGEDEKKHIPWQSSWGFSTRLIGALVMTHSDDKGLVLPPKIAPTKVVIIPIYKEKDKADVLRKANEVKDKLKKYSVELDDRDGYTPGWKFNEHEMKGIPLRIEIGPKDIENKQVILVRRDNSKKEAVKLVDLDIKVSETLLNIQQNLFKKADDYLSRSIIKVENFEQLDNTIKHKKIAFASFCGRVECEDHIKDKTGGATSRCIPFKSPPVDGLCVNCNTPAKYRVYFAKAY